MVPTLHVPQLSSVLNHGPVGCSTGFMVDRRGDWPALVREAAAFSTVAVELAALAEPELPSLIKYFDTRPELPFLFISAHAPTKQRRMSEIDLVGQLARIAHRVDAIVFHPDQIADPELYRPLGSKVVIENMDGRKESGQTADDLDWIFQKVPQAGLCFDIAHAKDVDPTMVVGSEILEQFGSRLRHVHLSSLDGNSHHIPLTEGDLELFAPLLSKCRDVPWIFEASPSMH